MADLTLAQLESIESQLSSSRQQASNALSDWSFLEGLLGATPSITLNGELGDLVTARAAVNGAVAALRKKIVDAIDAEVNP